MGKLTIIGSLPPDHPIYSGGPEIFSRPESNKSSTTTANATAGETQDKSASAVNQPETEADGKELGALRLAKMKHQNAQLRKGS
jgi:hypothetical protein